MDEDDIQLVLKEYNSIFVTYEIPPGVYTIEDSSGAVYTMPNWGTLRNENDDISMKTKPILSPLYC